MTPGFDARVATVEQLYPAYNARDLDILCRLAHPDIEIVPAGPVLPELPGASFHGHAGLRTIVRWSYANYPCLRLESSGTRIVSDGVLASATFVVDDQSDQVRTENHTLCRMEGERIRSAHSFATKHDALAGGDGASRGRAPLTPREREVFQLLVRGLNAPQIAAELCISPATVRTHVQNAMARLGASTRIHAVSIAIARREIEP
jgi:DNA-binding CsgD family transcriptional regulator/ketosteroid isomerase-like protein